MTVGILCFLSIFLSWHMWKSVALDHFTDPIRKGLQAILCFECTPQIHRAFCLKRHKRRQGFFCLLCWSITSQFYQIMPYPRQAILEMILGTMMQRSTGQRGSARKILIAEVTTAQGKYLACPDGCCVRILLSKQLEQ